MDVRFLTQSCIFFPKKEKYEDSKEACELRDILQGEKVVFFPSMLCSTCIFE